MDIKLITDEPYCKMYGVDAETYSVIYNGEEILGIKFFVDDELLIVNLPADKAKGLGQLILDAIARGRIV